MKKKPVTGPVIDPNRWGLMWTRLSDGQVIVAAVGAPYTIFSSVEVAAAWIRDTARQIELLRPL